MKKAVIATGGKQYLVSKGDELEIEYISNAGKKLSLPVYLVIDKDSTKIGTPVVEGAKVTAEVIDPKVVTEKVRSIRYKAKKRLHKVRGHRQLKTKIKIVNL